ncbi:DUF2288 domain-containing protein [Geobacter benzoatilyticus]|uniref:DUF2288 domain-containing protein n=1 Tax=Geobacter benzoatilyticus TaxID=2815309 RepID=A0ABX7Q685_9BACT|nr:DUF2288 domain-containing protein [Geobacter benzoatilyticus]QSV46610.1 DUF2288 domain-containing protein [Geobacter benzoatilyticus]
MKPTKEELALQVDVAEWNWLRAHLERGGLIVVDREIDIAEVAERIARDDTETVGAWIETGKLSKPNDEQVATWDANAGTSFSTLIISPYVLIKEQ